MLGAQPGQTSTRDALGDSNHTHAQHIAVMPAESDPRQAQKYECWARSQIRYMIGDSGRSYVVGFGSTPPSSEHHRGASCQLESSTGSDNPVCDWKDFALSTPNPNTLYGALVGGAPCPRQVLGLCPSGFWHAALGHHRRPSCPCKVRGFPSLLFAPMRNSLPTPGPDILYGALGNMRCNL